MEKNKALAHHRFMYQIRFLAFSVIDKRMHIAFLVAISTARDPQGSGRVDIFTHPCITASCAAGVVAGTAGRDSSRYRAYGNRRTRQLTLHCQRN